MCGNGGGEVDPTKQEMRISASSKGRPRRRRLSIFQGNNRENRGKEERRGGGGGNSKKGGGGGGGDNDDYNSKYHRCRSLYSSSSQIEANAAEDTMRYLEEVSKRWQHVGRRVEYI